MLLHDPVKLTYSECLQTYNIDYEESATSTNTAKPQITYRQYASAADLTMVMNLIDNELSEPYSIFTYRYFLHNWPDLCFLAFDSSAGHCVGVIICKQEMHRQMLRGYLAMLVVEGSYRGAGIGSALARMAISQMTQQGCEEVVLEAELSNKGALALYENLGFIRDKRLHKYYLNGSDAFRLKLLLPLSDDRKAELAAQQLATMGVQP